MNLCVHNTAKYGLTIYQSFAIFRLLVIFECVERRKCFAKYVKNKMDYIGHIDALNRKIFERIDTFLLFKMVMHIHYTIISYLFTTIPICRYA